MSNLNSLGIAYSNIADTKQSIRSYEDGLVIARGIGDREWEGVLLMNLGGSYGDLGKTKKALQLTEEAMIIQKETGNRRHEGSLLTNLANHHFELGDMPKAIELLEKGLVSAKKRENPLDKALSLANLAGFLAVDGQYQKAIDCAEQSISIGLNTGKTLSFEYGILAQAYLLNGNLVDARSNVEKAEKYNEPQNNYNVLALLGIIALRQNDLSVAQNSFETAIAKADEILNRTPEYYDALDAKGLAKCGLALIIGQQYLLDAIKCFQSARAINRATGTIKRRLCLFHELKKSDFQGILARIQPVIDGNG